METDMQEVIKGVDNADMKLLRILSSALNVEPDFEIQGKQVTVEYMEGKEIHF